MVSISIGYLTASAGEKISGNVPILNPSIDSINETTIPITIVNGHKDGPTLLALSGIHGSEYIPIKATQRLAKEVDPSHLHGAVILVHIANLPAYLGRTVYSSPADGKNLNRVFPGNPNGTVTERIADFLVEEVYPAANYVLDMHSGDANEQLGPSYTAYYGKAGSPKVIAASKAMAIAFGLDLVVEFQWELMGTNNDTSNAIWAGSAAVVRGIPSIDVEMAPGMGTAPFDSVDRAYHGVLRVMSHLGILETTEGLHVPSESAIEKETLRKPCLVKERHFIEAPKEGSWVPLVDTGTYVARGTLLGYMTDFYGTTQIFHATSPEDGLLLIRFESPPVVEGDTLAVVAVLNTSVPGCDSLKQDCQLSTYATIDNQNLWQWAAVTGWLVAFGFVFVTLKRRKKAPSYQPASVELCEGSLT